MSSTAPITTDPEAGYAVPEYPAISPDQKAAAQWRRPSPLDRQQATDTIPDNQTPDGGVFYSADHVEQAAKSLRMCGKGHIVGTHITGHEIKIIPLFCKRWDCPTCGPAKRRIWYARLMSGRPERLITVTHRPTSEYGPYEAAQKLKRTWSRFADNFRRSGRQMEYAWCLQYTEAGWPHLHLLQRGSFVPQAELSLFFRLKLGSPIVDVRRVKEAPQAAAYITRYMLRAAESDAAAQPDGFRIQTSLNYCIDWDDRQAANDDPSWTWKYDPRPMLSILQDIEKRHNPVHYRLTEAGSLLLWGFATESNLIPCGKTAEEGDPDPPPGPPRPIDMTLWPDDATPDDATLS